jgi:DNA-binding transcriptional MocR family regulator
MSEVATLYETVADRVQAMIEEGTLRAGDRIPSVRRLHAQWSVSKTTVLEAYRLLEDRGWVEARPRSGYYVRPNPRLVVREPDPSDPPQRPQRVRTDLVMRLQAEINAPGVIRLGAAAPDLDLLPHRVLASKVAEVMRRHPRTCHGYMTGRGYEPLRREIARRMVDAGCAVSPADVVITGGAQESLLLSLKAITNPGDIVAVESPCYLGLLEILEELHLRAWELRTHPRDGIDLDDLDDALRHQDIAACALVANFSNPLGSCMPDDNKRALIELLEHHQIPLVEDDVYGELAFSGPRPRAVKAFDDSGLVLYASSFSKTISPGFRVGWMMPGRYLERAMWLKNMMSIAAPSIPQLALAAYLQEGGYDRQLRRLRRLYRDNLARTIAAIGRYFPPGTRASQPQGGQLLWVQMPRAVSALKLYEQVAEHRISVAPGVLFSASGRYEHCMRLNLALRYDERVESALQILGRLATGQLAR